MGKYRDHRQGRSHDSDREQGFERSEPEYFQRRATRTAPVAVGAASAYDAEVVWFNAEKGFGFAKLPDGSEAFLHGSKLQTLGHNSLPDGAILKVHTEPGKKGAQVAEVLAVEFVGGDTVTPARPSYPAREGGRRGAEPLEDEAPGVVKTYDAKKGYGFIKITNGAQDVFVHATAVTDSGLPALEAGQTVVVSYAKGQRGLEARSLRLI